MLLDTGLGQAVSDAADEGLVSGEGLKNVVSYDHKFEQAV
jgi:hypothetical protein